MPANPGLTPNRGPFVGVSSWAVSETVQRLDRLRGLIDSFGPSPMFPFNDFYLKRLKFPIPVKFYQTLYRDAEEKIILDNLWDLIGLIVTSRRVYGSDERFGCNYQIHTAEGLLGLTVDPALDLSEFVSMWRAVDGFNRLSKQRAKDHFLAKYPAVTLM